MQTKAENPHHIKKQQTTDNVQQVTKYWLFICCVMVVGMVALGGLTRLTESGLSMVRWEPITGAIPPLTHDAWVKEFSDYKQSPQYQKIFTYLDIEGFKQIYWLEFFHRLLGRMVGLVFALPYIYFLVRKKFSSRQAIRLGGIFILGGFQGFMGWYMVKSGLVDDPQVSPFRLTSHLLLAIAILTLLMREIFVLSPATNQPRTDGYLLKFSLIALISQIALGGLMAGTDAGFTYNSFPLMDGDLVPAELDLSSLNIATVNFLHRWSAFFVAALFLILFWHRRADKYSELSLFIIIIQIFLGVLTLLGAVPVALASMHQICAIWLWIVVWMLYNPSVCGVSVKHILSGRLPAAGSPAKRDAKRHP